MKKIIDLYNDWNIATVIFAIIIVVIIVLILIVAYFVESNINSKKVNIFTILLIFAIISFMPCFLIRDAIENALFINIKNAYKEENIKVYLNDTLIESADILELALSSEYCRVAKIDESSTIYLQNK